MLDERAPRFFRCRRLQRMKRCPVAQIGRALVSSTVLHGFVHRRPLRRVHGRPRTPHPDLRSGARSQQLKISIGYFSGFECHLPDHLMPDGNPFRTADRHLAASAVIEQHTVTCVRSGRSDSRFRLMRPGAVAGGIDPSGDSRMSRLRAALRRRIVAAATVFFVVVLVLRISMSRLFADHQSVLALVVQTAVVTTLWTILTRRGGYTVKQLARSLPRHCPLGAEVPLVKLSRPINRTRLTPKRCRFRQP
jgi:predicted secreted protein